MPTRPGARDRLITIQVATKSQDGQSGETSLSWRALATNVAAEVRQPKGGEVFVAQQFVAKVEAIFNIRYRTDVTPSGKYRIVYEGRNYDITAVLTPPGSRRRAELDLYANARSE